MKADEISEYLIENGIKPTANRILVARELIAADRPLSLANLELLLDPMDKASIFRVLELLTQKELLHVIEDGSRSIKYELCHNGHRHTVADQHVHFYCEECKETTCLESVRVPLVNIPAEYVQNSINYMIKGICPKCNK